MDEPGREFLPPQPAWPEPELGSRPAPAAPPAPPPPAYGGWQPPQPPGWQAPPPGPQQAPPPGQQQAAPPGWQQPPPPGWGYPAQAQPDNGPAVAGFVLSVVSGGLLLISFGVSSIISLACAIFGLV